LDLDFPHLSIARSETRHYLLHPRPSVKSVVKPLAAMPADVELTELIIGAAMKVLNTLKPGLDEKLYERALVIELTKQGLTCDQQKQHPVHYDEQPIGTLIPDLIVNDTVIVDAKVVTAFNDSHLAQMLGYLNITGLKTALLLNFKHARLQIKRVSN
jgi:GxxExxY protein